MTGQDEIETVFDQLEAYSTNKTALECQLIVVPCYGTLPFEEQQRIFEPTPQGFRKVINLYVPRIVHYRPNNYFSEYLGRISHKHCRNFHNNRRNCLCY